MENGDRISRGIELAQSCGFATRGNRRVKTSISSREVREEQWINGFTSQRRQENNDMGANRQQGWALLLFLLGFTFLPAGLFGLGFVFVVGGLVCLIVSVAWFIKLRPLEHAESTKGLEAITPPRKKAV